MFAGFSEAEKSRGLDAIIGFVADGSHAWLVVSLDDEVGFPKAEQFCSKFSFLNLAGSNFAGDVYLEEDCDAPAFLKAIGLDDWTGIAEYQLPEDHTVRELPRGTAEVA